MGMHANNIPLIKFVVYIVVANIISSPIKSPR